MAKFRDNWRPAEVPAVMLPPDFWQHPSLAIDETVLPGL